MFFQLIDNASYQIRQSLLWEYNMDNFDWQKMRNTVIQRVIERGRLEDFQAIIQKYGWEQVTESIKQIPNLNSKDFAFVCAVFNIKKEDLKCYTPEQSQIKHWNS
jgi:hypothetical protein